MTSKFLIAALAATALGAVAADARPSRSAAGGDAQAKAATRQLNEQQLASAAGSTGTAPGMSAPSTAAAPADPAAGPGPMSSDAPPPPPAPDAAAPPAGPADPATPPADAPPPPR